MSDWIKHDGLKVPVPLDVLVDVKYRDGEVVAAPEVRGHMAAAYAWGHSGGDMDIVPIALFMPQKPPPPP